MTRPRSWSADDAEAWFAAAVVITIGDVLLLLYCCSSQIARFAPSDPGSDSGGTDPVLLWQWALVAGVGIAAGLVIAWALPVRPWIRLAALVAGAAFALPLLVAWHG